MGVAEPFARKRKRPFFFACSRLESLITLKLRRLRELGKSSHPPHYADDFPLHLPLLLSSGHAPYDLLLVLIPSSLLCRVPYRVFNPRVFPFPSTFGLQPTTCSTFSRDPLLYPSKNVLFPCPPPPTPRSSLFFVLFFCIYPFWFSIFWAVPTMHGFYLPAVSAASEL